MTYDVCFEVTRWCNLLCAHCLRGDRQKLRMKLKYAENFLRINRDSYIDCLLFTGGEPLLAPDIIAEILNLIKIYKVRYSYFYITTNAVKVSKKCIDVINELLWYADDKGSCIIGISNDIYHGSNCDADVLFDTFGSYENGGIVSYRFKEKYEKNYFNGENIIAQGRGQDVGGTKEVKYFEFKIANPEDENYHYAENPLYINAKGQVIEGCVWSYENQSEHIIGNTDSFNVADYLLSTKNSNKILQS